MKKLVVICPDEETKQAILGTFTRLSSTMGLLHGFTNFIAEQDDTQPEAAIAAAIGPAVFLFIEGFQEIYPRPGLIECDMKTLDNVYNNLNFRKDG